MFQSSSKIGSIFIMVLSNVFCYGQNVVNHNEHTVDNIIYNPHPKIAKINGKVTYFINSQSVRNKNGIRKKIVINQVEAFAILDSIYGFNSFIDYDSTSLKIVDLELGCGASSGKYKLNFLKNGRINLNYEFLIYGYGVKCETLFGNIVNQNINVFSAKLIENETYIENGETKLKFKDLSSGRHVNWKNPDKYISSLLYDTIQNHLQVVFNEKEVYGTEIDEKMAIEIVKDFLKFDDENLELKSVKERNGEIVKFNYSLYYKGIPVIDQRNPNWIIAGNDTSLCLDYIYGCVYSNVKVVYPDLKNLNVNPISKRKARKKLDNYLKEFLEEKKSKLPINYNFEDLEIKSPTLKIESTKKTILLYNFIISTKDDKPFKFYIDMDANSGKVFYINWRL